MGIRVSGENPGAWHIDFASAEGNPPAAGEPVQWLAPSGDIVAGIYDGAWLLRDGTPIDYTPAYWAPREDRSNGDGTEILVKVLLRGCVVLAVALAALAIVKSLLE